ncbi:MAG TPA: hypothetical protein VIH46_01280 [Candidatus Acidoferrales bacterium]
MQIQHKGELYAVNTAVRGFVAGAAFWALIWAAIHKLDEIPYLKEFTSTQEVLDWIEDHKGLTLVITEGVNGLLHGLSPQGVMFTLGGTITPWSAVRRA